MSFRQDSLQWILQDRGRPTIPAQFSKIQNNNCGGFSKTLGNPPGLENIKNWDQLLPPPRSTSGSTPSPLRGSRIPDKQFSGDEAARAGRVGGKKGGREEDSAESQTKNQRQLETDGRRNLHWAAADNIDRKSSKRPTQQKQRNDGQFQRQQQPTAAAEMTKQKRNAVQKKTKKKKKR